MFFVLNQLITHGNLFSAPQCSNFLLKKEKRCIFNVSLLFDYCRRPESNRYGYHYPRDFKSRASASSATAAYGWRWIRTFLLSFQTASIRYYLYPMDGGGFEPPKQFAADLQSVPFGHSGIHPYLVKAFTRSDKIEL